MDATISCCPICGGKASATHLEIPWQGLDFGWVCGCNRYALNDGIHGIASEDINTPEAEAMRPVVEGYSKAEVVRKWNEKAEKIMELMKDNG